MEKFNSTITTLFMIFVMIGSTTLGHGTPLSGEEIIDFEQATRSSRETFITEGGFDWKGIGVTNVSDATIYESGVVSGDYVAYNWKLSASSVSGRWFYLSGFFATSVFDEILDLTVKGYGESEVFVGSYEINNLTPTWVEIGFWTNKVKFIVGDMITRDLQGASGYFSLDNFTYSDFQPAPVPEPTTMVLLGIGLLSLGFMGRRMTPVKT